MAVPTSVPRYPSPAAKSVQDMLRESHPSIHWSLQAVLQSLRPKQVKRRLGAETSRIDFDGREWLMWEKDVYTLYLTESGIDLDLKDVTLETAFKALQWDMGLSRQVLTRAVHQRLHAQGRAKGLEVKDTIPSLPLDKLRAFVLDYCDGKLLCDHQVKDHNLLGFVFMPLALGALQVPRPEKDQAPHPAWVAQQTLVKDLGPEPVVAPPPVPPVKPPYPPAPLKPENWLEPDPERIRVIEDDIRWQVASPDTLDLYLEEIRLHNVGVDYHFLEATKRWAAKKRSIDREYQKTLRAHEKTLRELDIANRGIVIKHRAWERQKARQEALLEGFMSGWRSDLAIIYEYYDKAGPRGINGYPTFWSFSLMNVSDWERARKAIYRELERRESMEI